VQATDCATQYELHHAPERWLCSNGPAASPHHESPPCAARACPTRCCAVHAARACHSRPVSCLAARTCCAGDGGRPPCAKKPTAVFQPLCAGTHLRRTQDPAAGPLPRPCRSSSWAAAGAAPGRAWSARLVVARTPGGPRLAGSQTVGNGCVWTLERWRAAMSGEAPAETTGTQK
jgi:hypothetical protein